MYFEDCPLGPPGTYTSVQSAHRVTRPDLRPTAEVEGVDPVTETGSEWSDHKTHDYLTPTVS